MEYEFNRPTEVIFLMHQFSSKSHFEKLCAHKSKVRKFKIPGYIPIKMVMGEHSEALKLGIHWSWLMFVQWAVHPILSPDATQPHEWHFPCRFPADKGW